MASLRYLNTILTILAVLLALQIWTSWTHQPSMLPAAHAAQPEPSGLANPAAQRKEMIDLLKKLNVQAEAMNGMFKSGNARVKLESAPGENRN